MKDRDYRSHNNGIIIYGVPAKQWAKEQDVLTKYPHPDRNCTTCANRSDSMAYGKLRKFHVNILCNASVYGLMKYYDGKQEWSKKTISLLEQEEFDYVMENGCKHYKGQLELRRAINALAIFWGLFIIVGFALISTGLFLGRIDLILISGIPIISGYLLRWFG